MEILEGRFRVIKRLGNGAFGEIYKVEKKKMVQFTQLKLKELLKTQNM